MTLSAPPEVDPFSPAGRGWSRMVRDILDLGGKQHEILWGVGTSWIRYSPEGWLLDELVYVSQAEVLRILEQEGQMPDLNPNW